MTRFRKLSLTVFTFFMTMLVCGSAYAEGAHGGIQERDQWIAIAAGLGIAIAAFGGALGQGKTASTALDAIGRNPGAAGKIFTPMILGLALIESLVIYALLISFLLQGKIGA